MSILFYIIGKLKTLERCEQVNTDKFREFTYMQTCQKTWHSIHNIILLLLDLLSNFCLCYIAQQYMHLSEWKTEC